MSLAVGVMAAGAPSAAADVGTFPGGTTVNVARDDPTRAVFPMDLGDGIDPRKVRVRIVDVRQDDIPAQDLHDAVVKADFLAGVPGVRLKFDDADAEVGTYDVTLRVRQGKQAQFVTFALTRESAEVTTSSSLAVDHEDTWRVVGWLGLLGDLAELGPTDEPPLLLRVGPHDELTGDDFTVTETDSARGTVTGDFTTEDRVIRYDYAFADLPLGTSAQTLEFSSPQLEVPLVVTLNVSNRRPLALIGLMVLLGLLAGAGLRRWIEPTIARLEARLALLDLVETIKTARQDHSGPADAWRRTKMDEALQIARGVPEHATTQTILARTKQAEELFAASLGTPPVQLRLAVGGGPIRRGAAKVLAVTEPLRLRASLFVLRWVRAVVLAVVLLFAAYALYADTWTGSWQQLVLVLSWAFALDVTTAAVSGELAKMSTPTPDDQPPDDDVDEIHVEAEDEVLAVEGEGR